MSEFGQYTTYLGRNSKVVQFLLDSHALYKMTVAEGQMAIGHKELSPSTKIVIGKTAYDIQGPTSSFDALVPSDNSATKLVSAYIADLVSSDTPPSVVTDLVGAYIGDIENF